MPRREDKLEQSRHRVAIARRTHARDYSLCLQLPNPAEERSRYYMYNFKMGSPQDDEVIRLTKSTIRQLRQHPEHGLRMCNNNVHVFPTTNAPPIWPLKPTADAGDNNVKLYTFTQDGEEFPATVPVSIIPREGSLTADKLHVRTVMVDWMMTTAFPDIKHIRGVKLTGYVKKPQKTK